MNEAMPKEIWLEDIVLDETIPCGSFRLTEREIIDFASQYDPQPFHLSIEAANSSAFGGLVASSVQTIALSVRQMVRGLAGVQIMGGLAWENVKLLRPVWPERDYEVTVRWVNKRPSASKPDRGVAQIDIEVAGNEGPAVTYRVTYLVKRRPD